MWNARNVGGNVRRRSRDHLIMGRDKMYVGYVTVIIVMARTMKAKGTGRIIGLDETILQRLKSMFFSQTLWMHWSSSILRVCVLSLYYCVKSTNRLFELLQGQLLNGWVNRVIEARRCDQSGPFIVPTDKLAYEYDDIWMIINGTFEALKIPEKS